MELGIWLDSRFPDRINLLRLTMLPTSDGRGPENELYAKFRLEDREGSKTSLGIEPFNRWFSDRSRRYKFLSLPEAWRDWSFQVVTVCNNHVQPCEVSK